MIYFTNSNYKIDITTGVVTLLDASSSLIATMGYAAEYGIVADWKSPILASNSTVSYVRDASQLSVGDPIKFVSEEVNERTYHTATITEINYQSPNKTQIVFTPQTGAIGIANLNAQMPHGANIKKTTYSFSSISNIVVTTEAITGGTKIILTGDTIVADIVIVFTCLDNSFNLKTEIEHTYKGTHNVFREKITWTFVDAVSSVLTKNRRIITSSFGSNYWLGNNGCSFGTSTRKVLTYNNLGCSSVELTTTTKLLTFNLDDDRDHRFRRVVELADGTGLDNNDGLVNEMSQATYNENESKTNEFNLYVSPLGADHNMLSVMPSPDGFKSVFVWDSHADDTTRKFQKCFLYGKSDHVIGQPTAKGIIGNGIHYTHGVWYRHAVDVNHAEYSRDILADAYSKGIEVKLHALPLSLTTGYTQAQILAMKAAAMQVMHDDYNMQSWSDHFYRDTPEDLMVNGLDPTKDHYMKALWDQYGVKYFGTASGEDVEPKNLDVIGGSSQATRSPLYYKHPTIIPSDYRISCQGFRGFSAGVYDYVALFTESRLQELANNWGAYIAHVYITMPALYNHMTLSGGVYTLKDDFNDVLVRLKRSHALGNINVSTLISIMKHWHNCENITITPLSAKRFRITNNGEAIDGLSLSCLPVDAVSGITATIKNSCGHSIITFNMPANSTVDITLINAIYNGEDSDKAVTNVNETFTTAASIAGGTMSEITKTMTTNQFFTAVNNNLTALGGNSQSLAYGMIGKTVNKLISDQLNSVI